MQRFILGAIALLLFSSLAPAQSAQQQSQYSITSQVPFNQSSYFPIEQTVSPQLYYPTGEWVGRLILPTIEELQQANLASDWCWIEVQEAVTANQNLVGQKIRLTWKQTPDLQAYVNKVTTDVNFTETAEKSQAQGNVLPTRLNGRSQVGPLQSLSGARPSDSVVVRLDQVQVVTGTDGFPILQIEREPTQVTGRYVGLFEILKSTADQDPYIPVCPGDPPCPGNFFKARHYNRESQQFDGPQGTIYIPQQPPGPKGVFSSTPRYIEDSPEGKAGWYLYGAQNQNGVFTVQAVQPRRPFQLKPELVVLGRRSGLDYIKTQNWYRTKDRKGTAQSVLIDPSATTAEAAIADWQEGDYALLIHLFGGIGGENGEPAPFGTVTGHFAYGVTQVVRDPFTSELKFNPLYEQVYAQNPNGILAGSHTWANYMGNLQRGWLGTRPVSDVVVKLDALTQDYDFDGIVLSPMQELLTELQIMTARYRTGDGTGVSLVTPAVSCVQDANQALYITIERIKQKFSSTPAIQDWLKTHPNDPQTLRFQELAALGQDITAKLAPRGVVRSDWKENAEFMAGINNRNGFVLENTLANALLSWQSMLPRNSHDEVSSILLDHGAQLWFIRTNQVGGEDPGILPVAPTVVMGQWPIVPTFLNRLVLASVPIQWKDIVVAFSLLALYGAIAVPIGLLTGFIEAKRGFDHWTELFWGAVRTLFAPALLEELIFRVFIVPHPSERVSFLTGVLWVSISVLLFVIYHPVMALTHYPAGKPTFFDPTFLTLVALLGVTCAIAYILSPSLWTVTLIHWIVVMVWLYGLGGNQRLAFGPVRERSQVS